MQIQKFVKFDLEEKSAREGHIVTIRLYRGTYSLLVHWFRGKFPFERVPRYHFDSSFMSVLYHTLFPTVLCGQTSKRGNYNSWKQFLLLGRVTTILLPEIEDNRNLYPEIYNAFYLFKYSSLSLHSFL